LLTGDLTALVIDSFVHFVYRDLVCAPENQMRVLNHFYIISDMKRETGSVAEGEKWSLSKLEDELLYQSYTDLGRLRCSTTGTVVHEKHHVTTNVFTFTGQCPFIVRK
jgi:hypothetical protein